MLKDEIEELKGSVETMEKEVKEQTLALEIFQEMKVENKRKKENANFTIEELTIFEMLTGKYGRETIVYIADKMNLSTATVSRRIKKIKSKIKKLI